MSGGGFGYNAGLASMSVTYDCGTGKPGLYPKTGSPCATSRDMNVSRKGNTPPVFGYKPGMNTFLDADAPQRLGFAVKVLGENGSLKSSDARRWQSDPHMSVTIGYLHELFAYLVKNKITMYRMATDLVPYCTHPDMPRFWGQVRECAADLAALGNVARDAGIRLSMHPSQYVVLNSPDPVRPRCRDPVRFGRRAGGGRYRVLF